MTFDTALAAEAVSLKQLNAEIGACRACPLWKNATQAVCGQGTASARVLLVGEQPGDQEDSAGKPFVGPAGQLLDQALVRASVDRGSLYVTNAVKHFSWELRGKRRLHKTPTQTEIIACRGWLLGEIRLVAPRLIVCLGATALRSLLGPGVRVLANRGKILASALGAPVLVTVHPSSILRTPAELREQAFASLVSDLKHIRERG